jgi:hypothetical protein
LPNQKQVPRESDGSPHLELEHALHCVAYHAAENHSAHETRARRQIQPARFHYSRLSQVFEGEVQVSQLKKRAVLNCCKSGCDPKTLDNDLHDVLSLAEMELCSKSKGNSKG